MISRIPSVLITNSATNQPVWLFFAARHSARPFQTMVQRTRTARTGKNKVQANGCVLKLKKYVGCIMLDI